MSVYSFSVVRRNERRTSSEKLCNQLQKMAIAALRGDRGRKQGWVMLNQITAPQPKFVGGEWEYRFTYKFSKKDADYIDDEIVDSQFEYLKDMVQLAGNVHNWTIVDQDDQIQIHNQMNHNEFDSREPDPIRINSCDQPSLLNNDSYNGINIDPTGFFEHLYDRDAQINVILSSLITAVESDFKIRNHVLIEGDPAGGKTTLAEAVRDMVGEAYCHYIDATTSTQAGILQELMDVPSTVKILIIEEIEKVKPDDLRWLLSVMDDRGMINVCNARVGVLKRKLPLFVIATVNDTYKLEGFQSGALASRFGDRVYCPRLSKDTIFRAVKKSVDDINGNIAWINPAIDYCVDEEGTYDIRRIKAVATNGRDRLLTGEYQQILRATSRRKT